MNVAGATTGSSRELFRRRSPSERSRGEASNRIGEFHERSHDRTNAPQGERERTLEPAQGHVIGLVVAKRIERLGVEVAAANERGEDGKQVDSLPIDVDPDSHIEPAGATLFDLRVPVRIRRKINDRKAKAGFDLDLPTFGAQDGKIAMNEAWPVV